VTNGKSGDLLDVENASTTNGALIDQWPSTGGTNQNWTLNSVS
jgi:Ricin-type beta-trefoil lectin domain-like